jgi:potassium-dependent mechanosensitive channel
VLQRSAERPVIPSTAHLAAIAASFSAQKLPGAILLLGDRDAQALGLAALRRHGVRNRVVGTSGLASRAFLTAFARAWDGESSMDAALNGTLVTAPLLFDTASEQAQRFRAAFLAAHGEVPDWQAALAHDGLRLLAQGLRDTVAAAGDDRALRDGLDSWLEAQALSEAGTGVDLATLRGPARLGPDGDAALPPLVGVYDGTNLVAALTQLSPIREEGCRTI